jgi:hypothetical protein
MPNIILSNPDTLNRTLETWFIQNILFDGAPYCLDLNGEQISNPQTIYMEMGIFDLDLINQIKSSKSKKILYHVGDERGNHDYSSYLDFDLIIRNYFFPHVFDDQRFCNRVIWAPNGFRTGVGPRPKLKIKRSKNRTCFAAFLGWMSNDNSYKNERSQFLDATKFCGENLFVLASNGFGGGYNVGLYSTVMEDSIFAPCPAGNSPETIRLYDALELGCIPISLPHAFLTSDDALAAIGPVPFPIIASWDELPSFLDRMKLVALSKPDEIVSLQAKTINWWDSYKQFIQNKISTKINLLHS